MHEVLERRSGHSHEDAWPNARHSLKEVRGLIHGNGAEVDLKFPRPVRGVGDAGEQVHDRVKSLPVRVVSAQTRIAPSLMMNEVSWFSKNARLKSCTFLKWLK